MKVSYYTQWLVQEKKIKFKVIFSFTIPSISLRVFTDHLDQTDNLPGNFEHKISMKGHLDTPCNSYLCVCTHACICVRVWARLFVCMLSHGAVCASHNWCAWEREWACVCVCDPICVSLSLSLSSPSPPPPPLPPSHSPSLSPSLQ